LEPQVRSWTSTTIMTRRNKSPNPSSSTPALELDPTLVATAPEAFALVRPEIEAVPAHALIRINLDLPRAARCGLVAAERIEPLLPELARLHRYDIRAVRMLGTYALAMLHTHDLAAEGDAELPPLPVLVTEAAPLREGLLRTAELLAHFGLVSPERAAAIRRGHGHADLAEDLLALGRLLVELWPRVHDKVVATRAQVDRAITLSALLHKALARHEAEQNPLTRHTSRRYLRTQAFTVFYRAYEETRRGVTYLRWYDGDARAIVPSLYPRKPRRLGGEEHAAIEEELVPPLAPSQEDGDAEELATDASDVVTDA
jgi:hypothetical protein